MAKPEETSSFRIADSRSDRLGAFQLVYRSYIRTGLGCPNRFEMRVTPFQLCESSQIFVEVSNSVVISTVTLVGDGESGLPMESIFSEEVASLRRKGRQLAEVTCLAHHQSDLRWYLGSFSQLTRLMAQFARYQGIENFLISVHPRHVNFFARYMGFRPLSDRIVRCPYVQGHPAVGLDLDFERIDVDRPQSWDDFFGDWEGREKLAPSIIPQEEREWLREVAQISYDKSGPDSYGKRALIGSLRDS